MPSNPLPEPNEGITDPVPMEYGISSGPSPVAPLEPVPPSPGAAMFPAWSWWDVLAVLGFTIFAVFLFSLVALAIARTIPAYKRIPVADLATDPRIVVGAQAAAYPVILILIFIVVRSRTHQRFRDAIHWRWPGISAPVFFLAGTILALVVEGLVKLPAHAQIVAHGQLLPQRLQRVPVGGVWHYPGAAAGRSVLPRDAVPVTAPRPSG